MGVPKFGKALGCILICLSFYLVTEFLEGAKCMAAIRNVHLIDKSREVPN